MTDDRHIPFLRDPLVLADGDRAIRRVTPDRVYAHGPAKRHPLTPRLIKAVGMPDAIVVREYDPEPVSTTWSGITADDLSAEVLRTLFDVGFEWTRQVVENRAYLRRGNVVIVLTVDLDNPGRITHLTHGNVTVPVAHAVAHLRDLR